MYRQSRNIEASIIDFLTTELVTDNWTVNVEKTFAKIYDIECPSICVRVGDTIHDRVEIGTTSTIRTVNVLLDIFATSDGQRLDLKDYLIDELKGGLVYYEYVVSNGTVQSKTANGRIRVLELDDTPIDFDVNKSDLDIHDRYRHLISLSVSLGQVEG